MHLFCTNAYWLVLETRNSSVVGMWVLYDHADGWCWFIDSGGGHGTNVLIALTTRTGSMGSGPRNYANNSGSNGPLQVMM